MENNNHEVEQEPKPFTEEKTGPKPDEEKSTEQLVDKSKRKKLLIGGAVVVAVVLLAGIGYLGQQVYERNQTSDEVEDTGEVAGVTAAGPVAVVNGVEIARERFDFRYNLEAKSAPSRGLDLNDESTQNFFASQVLENVVTVELLLQQAELAGISVTDEAVAAQYQIVVDTLGGEDIFNEQLANDNITPADLLNDIREQLIIENFVSYYSESVGIEVTEEEITQAYEDASLTSEDLPPQETVSEQIKSQMLQQRGVEAVNQLLESVKETSDIELLL